MKLFGIVQSFDMTKGFGSIQPETGGDALRFDRSAFSWQPSGSTTAGQRLSYDLAHTNGQPSAVNLAKI